MRKADKKLRRYKIKPIFLPNGDILNADALMIKHDFYNDPVFKAKREEALAEFRKYPPPGTTAEDWK
jgi:hypothetical protein